MPQTPPGNKEKNKENQGTFRLDAPLFGPGETHAVCRGHGKDSLFFLLVYSTSRSSRARSLSSGRQSWRNCFLFMLPFRQIAVQLEPRIHRFPVACTSLFCISLSQRSSRLCRSSSSWRLDWCSLDPSSFQRSKLGKRCVNFPCSIFITSKRLAHAR
ncbi:hypothetical protein B0H12DRAFT_1117871 [Mycena haematopus]|nr:hypothetical protein B0H12DRAFT_1117871 [Mycena haematopus]